MESLERNQTSLNDFEIVKSLGEGAFSKVYKVTRKSDNEEYALKKVKIGQLKKKEKENALNEIRILASIDHLHIVAYKEAFIDPADGDLCIVMEYLGGGDLYMKIKECKRKRALLPESLVWKYLAQMVSGLKQLHSMGILHRDLKCANVFISTDLKMVKLGDLNVSKIAENSLVYTQTGTPFYASPEVWRDEPYDSKSDIWSLGCVIYEMCSRKPPFTAKNMEELFHAVQKGTFERIPSKYYSNELQKLLEQCLSVDPKKRPNCDELLNDPVLKTKIKQENTLLMQNAKLLEVIDMTTDLSELNKKLPKAQYAKIRSQSAKVGRTCLEEEKENNKKIVEYYGKYLKRKNSVQVAGSLRESIKDKASVVKNSLSKISAQIDKEFELRRNIEGEIKQDHQNLMNRIKKMQKIIRRKPDRPSPKETISKDESGKKTSQKNTGSSSRFKTTKSRTSRKNSAGKATQNMNSISCKKISGYSLLDQKRRRENTPIVNMSLRKRDSSPGCDPYKYSVMLRDSKLKQKMSEEPQQVKKRRSSRKPSHVSRDSSQKNGSKDYSLRYGAAQKSPRMISKDIMNARKSRSSKQVSIERDSLARIPLHGNTSITRESLNVSSLKRETLLRRESQNNNYNNLNGMERRVIDPYEEEFLKKVEIQIRRNREKYSNSTQRPPHECSLNLYRESMEKRQNSITQSNSNIERVSKYSENAYNLHHNSSSIIKNHCLGASINGENLRNSSSKIRSHPKIISSVLYNPQQNSGNNSYLHQSYSQQNSMQKEKSQVSRSSIYNKYINLHSSRLESPSTKQVAVSTDAPSFITKRPKRPKNQEFQSHRELNSRDPYFPVGSSVYSRLLAGGTGVSTSKDLQMLNQRLENINKQKNNPGILEVDVSTKRKPLSAGIHQISSSQSNREYWNLDALTRSKMGINQ